MPTNPANARILLKHGKAKVIKRTPFVIQLLYETTEYIQPVTVGIEIIKTNKTTPDLLSAAIKPLNDNLHLCDGDVCTLKDLRDAVAKIRPDWCQTPRAD